jgi:hypothetical protein
MIVQPPKEPELTISIGTICIRWAYLEMLMSTYYGLMVFGSEIQDEQNAGAYLAVIDAFESLPTWNTKKTLIVAATGRRLNDKIAKKLDSLLKRVENRQRRRNNVVHARWFLSGEKGKWMRHRGLASRVEPEPYNVPKFKELELQIVHDTTELAAFFDELQPLLKESGLPLYLQALLGGEQKPADTLKGILGLPE